MQRSKRSSVFPKLTDEERNRVLFVNLVNGDPTETVLFLILDAQAADRHALTMAPLIVKDALADPLFDHRMKMNEEAVREIVEQDLRVDLAVQAGLGSRFAPRGRYSWQESAQRQFNLWLVDRYTKGHRQRMSVAES